ncbi:hypothetical protein I3843_01G030700 [Carya illinoinensis]|nr:hypothetical protein I3843_01G030700 [Carya illinoinensis]
MPTCQAIKAHVLLFPSPGAGHLSHLSAGESGQLIQSAMTKKLINIVELPPVDISGKIEPNAQFFTRQAAITREIQPTLRSTISTLTLTPTALIVDHFATPALDIANEFHFLKYVFFPSAWPLSLMLYLPILKKEIQGEYVDQKEPLKIPGCMPVQPEDSIFPMLDRTKLEYNIFLQRGSEMRMSDGILLNTWKDLDTKTLKALREDESSGSVPIYAVGPFSVILISFGSAGVLSAQQITELAFGLELSQQKFPFGSNALDYLPNGFLKRTHGFGLVVTQWAPLVDILSHPSTGRFLSHCGILSGMPMITWPLYAEQKMNATKLAEEVGVAVRPKIAPTKGVVGREDIEMMVRKVMEDPEGKAMRVRVKELKISGEKALVEGGSSFNAMSHLAKKCLIVSKPIE